MLARPCCTQLPTPALHREGQVQVQVQVCGCCAQSTLAANMVLAPEIVDDASRPFLPAMATCRADESAPDIQLVVTVVRWAIGR